MKSIILLALGVAISTAALAAYVVHLASPRAHFQAKDITGVPWGRGFELNDSAGRPRTLADFRGKVVLLSFGYTSCPDVCPTTLALIGEAMKQLGADAARVQPLFVTLDPRRDTPQRLERYVGSFAPSFIALSGDAERTQHVAQEFKIHYHAHPQGADGEYDVDHSDPIYVIDSSGRLRLLVHPDASTPEAIVHDVRQIASGKG